MVPLAVSLSSGAPGSARYVQRRTRRLELVPEDVFAVEVDVHWVERHRHHLRIGSVLAGVLDLLQPNARHRVGVQDRIAWSVESERQQDLELSERNAEVPRTFSDAMPPVSVHIDRRIELRVAFGAHDR